MPEGKVIEFTEGEYPELDGLESGSPVKLTGQAVIEDMGDGLKGLRISSMEFETEGVADRELNKMKTQDNSTAPAGGAPDDFQF